MKEVFKVVPYGQDSFMFRIEGPTWASGYMDERQAKALALVLNMAMTSISFERVPQSLLDRAMKLLEDRGEIMPMNGEQCHCVPNHPCSWHEEYENLKNDVTKELIVEVEKKEDTICT